MSQQTIMSRSHDNEDGCFVAMDTEDNSAEPAGITAEEEAKMGSCRLEGHTDASAKGGGRTMLELPEEVLEYILSFLSPYQEHKTAALVCKQWYRLIKGIVLELEWPRFAVGGFCLRFLTHQRASGRFEMGPFGHSPLFDVI